MKLLAPPGALARLAISPSTRAESDGRKGKLHKTSTNAAPANYAERVLREQFLVPFRAAVVEAGAVVKPFEVMDATSKGVLDACHSVPVYWYGKSKVASLFGSGPINGCDAHQTLAWIYRGGGLALYVMMSNGQRKVVGAVGVAIRSKLPRASRCSRMSSVRTFCAFR